MKDFFKYTLATVTGLVITSILLVFISLLFFVGITSMSDTETKVESNTIMMLDLDGQLSERSQEEPWSKLFKEYDKSIGLDDVLSSIRKAKNNDNIKGIYIKAKWLSGSSASYQEIRDALLDFKKSKKFIIAYSDTYTQGMYYISSVADKVLLNPQGAIEWKGLAAQITYYKGLLDKFDVQTDVFKVGTFKSAVEPFTSTSMSPANRLQMNDLLHSIWNKMVADVSKLRKVSEAKLNEYADKMSVSFYPAEQSVKCGLADQLVYQSNVRDILKKLVGVEDDDDLHVLGLSDMVNVSDETSKDKSGDEIAVYYAAGEIVDTSSATSSEGESVVGEDVVKDLKDLREDDHVKAVVLRVNSPGGSAFASDQIWHAVQELKAKKPVVVSMGDYAASGGYYISCGANKIVAEPTTLTGSIGIFGMMMNYSKLANRFGITFDAVKTNKFSDIASGTRPMSEEEKALIQMEVAHGYEVFVSRCAAGRRKTVAAIKQVAEGRVWTGAKAKQLGLVDELGNIDKAIEIAARLAKVGDHTVTTYPDKKSIFDQLFEDTPDNYVKTQLLKSQLGNYYQMFSLINSIDKRSRIQARLPFYLNIY